MCLFDIGNVDVLSVCLNAGNAIHIPITFEQLCWRFDNVAGGGGGEDLGSFDAIDDVTNEEGLGGSCWYISDGEGRRKKEIVG